MRVQFFSILIGKTSVKPQREIFVAADEEAFILVEMAISDKIHFARRQKLDLLVLSPAENVQLRLQQLGHRFRLTLKRYSHLGEYESESSWFGQIPLIVAEKAEEIESLRAEKPTSFIVWLTSEKAEPEQIQNLLVKGASAALTQKDFDETVKFDFLCLQKIRAAYFPISIQDIFPMTEMTFNASIRLPLNQKYLAVLFRGFTLSEAKYRRIEQEGRLFIRTRETGDYLRYILNYNDGLGNGMRKRCRAFFLCLSAQYLDFLASLVLEAGPERVQKIQADYQKLEDLCGEILGYIQNRGDVDLWEVFQEALTNEIFEYWRGPWRAVYAGLVSETAKLGSPLEAMMAALLWDIAGFELPRDLFYEYADPKKERKSFAEKEIKNLPSLSLSWGETRGVLWKEGLTAILSDGETKSPEFWAVQTADLIDRGTRTFMLENKVTFQFLRKTIFEQKIQGDPELPPEIASALTVIAT